jgi:hypothetical protein
MMSPSNYILYFSVDVATRLCTEKDEASLHIPHYLYALILILIFHLHLVLSSGLIPSKTQCALLSFPIRSTYSAHLVGSNLIL